ncbi:MAG: flagellar hook capping protein [Thermoleophilia bacterium]|nr:flagellar hook capping protein [Thermoleophilia bacterium]
MTTTSATATFAPPTSVADPTKSRIVGKNEQGTDKEMFLKLMIAQLKNQDPTAPMDQKDMMASVTQFSQVEQMDNMAKAMETLSLAQGVGMIGKTVNYTSTIKDADGNVMRQEEAEGKVDHIEQTPDGGMFLVLEGVAAERIKSSAVTKVFA